MPVQFRADEEFRVAGPGALSDQQPNLGYPELRHFTDRFDQIGSSDATKICMGCQCCIVLLAHLQLFALS